MKRYLWVGMWALLSLVTVGCETVETVHKPADAYDIRKPADTTRATSRTEGIVIERKP